MGMVLSAERFTIADLEAIPDDGLHRELVDGVLFVNPLAASPHQVVAMRCVLQLARYLEATALGTALSPGRVLLGDHTALEPDVLVLPGTATMAARPWAEHPAPLLVVEIVSPSSRQIDYLLKRVSYASRGVGEYWIVDSPERCVTVVRPGRADDQCFGSFDWQPSSDHLPLRFNVAALFEGLTP
ncbi:MAG: Uma2 family endonuclease [Gemmatimonadaceae bacterium]